MHFVTISNVTGPKFTKIVHDVTGSLRYKAAYPCCDIPILLKCQVAEQRSVCHLCLKSVAMATSPEESEKQVQIDKIHANTFHLVKKIIIIGQVDDEIPLPNFYRATLC